MKKDEELWENLFSSFEPVKGYAFNSLANGDIYLQGVSENIPKWRERNMGTTNTPSARRSNHYAYRNDENTDNQYTQRNLNKTHPSHFDIGNKGGSMSKTNPYHMDKNGNTLNSGLNKIDQEIAAKQNECNGKPKGSTAYNICQQELKVLKRERSWLLNKINKTLDGLK